MFRTKADAHYALPLRRSPSPLCLSDRRLACRPLVFATLLAAASLVDVARAGMEPPRESATRQPTAVDPADENPDEGLKPIGKLGASIRMSEGELPVDAASARF